MSSLIYSHECGKDHIPEVMSLGTCNTKPPSKLQLMFSLKPLK